MRKSLWEVLEKQVSKLYESSCKTATVEEFAVKAKTM